MIIDFEAPIDGREALISWLEEGSKPAQQWRIGTECETIPFSTIDHKSIPYIEKPEISVPGNDIRTLLATLNQELNWHLIEDNQYLIGLSDPHLGRNISLEPGGQLEFSGTALDNIHATQGELQACIDLFKKHAQALHIGFLGLGFSPLLSLEETSIMPKERYRIMARYMPKVGQHGLDMMFRTATAQINLDFSSEADMLQKLRLSLSLQPLATALFANSPFSIGQPTGFLSTRSEIWRHTDPSRTGLLPSLFEGENGFERYTDYALNIPMYFIRRNGRYYDLAGASFKDFWNHKIPDLGWTEPTLADWEDHLSTLFPEVRLRHYLEMRGADTGDTRHVGALAAFWVGLLYDSIAQEEAYDVVKGWSAIDRDQLRHTVPQYGLNTQIKGCPLRELGKNILCIAKNGLKRRAKLNAAQEDECLFLERLEEALDQGAPAEYWLNRFYSDWERSVLPIFKEAAH